MAIITVLVLVLVIFVPAMLIEGCIDLLHRAKEAREWRKIKRVYYPERLVAARRDA